jgi:hypothetical protein
MSDPSSSSGLEGRQEDLPYRAGRLIRARITTQLRALSYDFDLPEKVRVVVGEAAGVMEQLDALALGVDAHQAIPPGSSGVQWLLPFYGADAAPVDWLPLKEWVAKRKAAARLLGPLQP